MSKAIKIIAIILLILAIIIVVMVVFFAPKTGEGIEDNGQNDSDALNIFYCKTLGCDEDTIYVGSVNSDKYYKCDCRWAKIIDPENIVCFKSDAEAIDAGYVKSEC